jgi:hypothetical protein
MIHPKSDLTLSYIALTSQQRGEPILFADLN